VALDIAVLTGKNGETISMDEPGTIAVYQRRQGKWDVLRETEFALDRRSGLGELRRQMAQILDFLGECKIFVALSVTGLPYFELEKAHCRVWEFEGKPENFLDYVLHREEEEQHMKEESRAGAEIPAPVETSNGCYRISLTEIQARNSGFTSKQVLLPFLRKAAFYSLEVICSHVPPWLEAETLNGNLASQVERISRDEIRVIITKKLCGQC